MARNGAVFKRHWPNPHSKICPVSRMPNEYFEHCMKWLDPLFRFSGFRYKLDAEGKYLTAMQLLLLHGPNSTREFNSPIWTADGETEEDMKEIRLGPF